MRASHLLLSSFFCSCFFFRAETACRTRPAPTIVPLKDDAQLKVLVPNITLEPFRRLVDCSDPSNVTGFCIDVFETALSLLPANLSPPAISYTCFNFYTSGTQTFTYNDMIRAVAEGLYDVVVGDVTISAQRAYNVGFTQEYMKSGVVIITKIASGEKKSHELFFVQPFTTNLWIIIAVAYLATGIALMIIENAGNHELNEGSSYDKIKKIFRFFTEEMVLLQRASIKSTGGEFIMSAWVLFVVLLTASYTAGLSSILTANTLSPTTIDIRTLRDSNKTIAYRKGSTTQDLLRTRFHIKKGQLEALRHNVDFINNLTKGPSAGGVIAIIDELPYANILLANLSCDYGIIQPHLTNEGFGFGFRPGLQPWVKEVSKALLNLRESGCLQEMQDKHKLTIATKCSSNGSHHKAISLIDLAPLLGALAIVIFLSVLFSCWKSQCQNPTSTQVEMATLPSTIT